MRYEVGQKVRCTDTQGRDLTEGKVYVIEEVDDNNTPRITDDIDDQWWITFAGRSIESGEAGYGCFELVDEEKKPTSMYHVGQKIRCTDDGDNSGLAVGKVYEVHRLDHGGFNPGAPIIKRDDGGEWYVANNGTSSLYQDDNGCFELVDAEEEKEEQFHVGQKVRCTDAGHAVGLTVGKEYLIQSLGIYGQPRIMKDNGMSWNAGGSTKLHLNDSDGHFELVKEDEKSESFVKKTCSTCEYDSLKANEHPCDTCDCSASNWVKEGTVPSGEEQRARQLREVERVERKCACCEQVDSWDGDSDYCPACHEVNRNETFDETANFKSPLLDIPAGIRKVGDKTRNELETRVQKSPVVPNRPRWDR